MKGTFKFQRPEHVDYTQEYFEEQNHYNEVHYLKYNIYIVSA